MNAQDNIVERVKAGNPIEDVIEESGYALERRHGKYVRSREHDSLVVNTRNQTYSWNSMSEIQEDVIAWVMHRNNWDFKAAMEWLARRAHLPEPKWSREDQAVREASRKREGIFQVAQQAMQRWLWADEEALGYCRGRGWTDETIRESGLGFSGRDPAAASLDLRGDFLLHDVDPECPQAAAILGWRGNVREWAAKWGMDLSEEVDWVKGGYLPGMIYKTRLVYAHYVNGKVQTFSGRNILGAEVNKEGREVKSYNLPRALAGERQVFYNHEYSTRAEELVIVEGQADAITLGQWGIPAVAMCGTAWQDKERLLEELGERHGKVYIGLDADQAGEKALRGRKDDWPLAGILGPMARVVRWPESDGGEGQKGKDANDWLRWGMKAMGLTDYNGEIIRQTLETEDQGPEIDAELLLQAVKVVREDKKASVSHLERAMKIGFPRATRLMEELEKAGVIGPADENGHRAVLEEGANDSNTAAEDPDRRREWVERLVKRQSEKAREWINLSLTMAEEAAQWAGKQKGGERDEAIRTAFGIIARMDKVQMATYRASLTAKLEMGIREFNDILKAAGQEIEDAPVLTVETLGGWIDGWLLEYIYDPKEETARLAWRDPDRKMGISEYVDIEGLRYVPRHVNNFVRDGGCLFASEIGGLKSTKELVTLVEMFLNQHYLLENKYLSRIIAYYVLLTWVYDCFNALPYLRAMGEAGAGKSELMRRIGHLCYRMMAASGANTAASFFRATETYRGTVFVDEADLYDGGDMSNDLVKFLNLGAMKGNPIWRLEEVLIEGGKSYEVATFSTFCPKLIAMRKDFKDDAVASRSLTIKLMPREPIELKARGIRLYIDEEFREKARAIRNLLLRWRFEKWEPEITVGEEHMDLDISSRLNQVTMPLKALAKDDPSLQGEIEKFLRAYNQDMVLTRSMTIAARAVEAMWKIWTEKSYRDKYLQAAPEGGGWWMMIGDVAKCANEIMDEMNALGTEEEESEEGKKKRKKDSLTARGIGSLIRNELQLQVGERRGKGFPVYWDELKMQALAKRYGVKVPEAQQEAAPGAMPPEPEEPPAQTPKQSEIPF